MASGNAPYWGSLGSSELTLVFPFGAGSRVFNTALRFGLIHRSLGFFSPFGTGFGAFLPFFVQYLFAAQQLDEGFFRPVALSPLGTQDAQIAALAVAKTRSEGFKQFV